MAGEDVYSGMSGSGVMLCLGCQYSLAALPRGVCPECGREFDPGDAATFFVPRMFMLSGGWSRAPDKWHFVIAGIMSLSILAAYWTVDTNVLLQMLAIGGLTAMLTLWLPRCVLRLVPQSRHRLRVEHRRFWGRVAALWLMPALAFWLVWCETPLKFRYLLSYGALRRAASEVERSEFNIVDFQGNGRSSSTVSAGFKVAGGVAIETWPRLGESIPWNADSIWDMDLSEWRGYGGVAYFKDTPPPRVLYRQMPDGPHDMWRFKVNHELVFEHMWGNWYLFKWKIRRSLD